MHDDAGSESFLTEHITTSAIGHRHPTTERLWEFGRRVGFPRLWRELTRRQLSVTSYGITMALGRKPDAVAAELPSWADLGGRPELFVPYALDASTMRFATSNGFAESE